MTGLGTTTGQSVPGGGGFAPSTDTLLLGHFQAGPTLGARAAICEIEARLFGKADEQRIGRYVVERKLGRGAFGSVYLARDPSLDRRVAVKLIRSAAGPDRGHRQLREAHALARLTHPNVVQIFDVGLRPEDDRLYLAMEYIAGESMRAWLQRGPHPTPRVIEALAAAGRGLAAAHAAGLVHRDFKPDNVLLSQDGHVKVADFGLARSLERSRLTTTQEDLVGSSVLSASLSATGNIMGTPAYMAPEIIEGGSADERSDQFSFCVVLFEALSGGRPFIAESIPALYAAHRDGPQWPNERPAAGLVRVVERGLSFDPAARFASMDELLAALDRAYRSRRNRWSFLTGAVAVGVLGLGGTIGSASPEPAVAFGDLTVVHPQQQLERARLRREIGAIDPLTDPDPSTEVTLLARARALGDEALVARAKVAIARRQLNAEQYHTAIGALEEASAVIGSSDPGMAVEAASLSCKLGFRVNGDAERAARHCARGLAIAERVDEPLLRAKMLSARGWHYADLSRLEASVRDLETAAALHEEVLGPDDLDTLGSKSEYARSLEMVGREEEAIRINEQVLEAYIEHFGPAHHILGSMYNNLASSLHGAGRLDEAIEAYERGLAIVRETKPHDSIHAILLTNLGSAYFERGRSADGLVTLERVLTFEASSAHITSIQLTARTNAGFALSAAGRNEAALVHFETAVDEAIGLAGERHRSTAMALLGKGIALYATARYEEAATTLRRARNIFDEVAGRDLDKWTVAHLYLARAAVAGGDLEEATRLVDVALASKAGKGPLRWDALRTRGWIAEKSGDWIAASEDYDAALAAGEASGSAPQFVASTLADAGRARWHAHPSKRDQARQLVELAISQAEALEPTPQLRKDIRSWRRWLRAHRS